MSSLEEWERVTAIVISLAAIVAIMGKFYRRKVSPALKTLRLHAHAASMLPELVESVDEIRKQLHTNGGTSMRDAINRIEDRQLLNLQMIQAVYGHGYFRSNKEGSVIECSRSLFKTFGRSEVELLGNMWLTWVANKDRDRIWREWSAAVSQQRDMEESFAIKGFQGKESEVRLAAQKLTGRDGGYLGHLGVFTRIVP